MYQQHPKRSQPIIQDTRLKWEHYPGQSLLQGVGFSWQTDTGQTLDRHWKDTRQALDRHWPDKGGQKGGMVEWSTLYLVEGREGEMWKDI